MPPKSIFRQPGARHFQLVHRSQRDPLIHDPEASQHVLRPYERENVKKGKSRADLENVISPDELAHDLERANIGEATLYGVYYDDTDYDYMQHLRQVGLKEDGVDSVLLEAPVTALKLKKKGKPKDHDFFPDLPPEALPSTSELPRDYDSLQAVPASLAGLQPDMDPHLRQVLEALEDEAFVEDSLEDDFFGELVADGEREEDEAVEFDFQDSGILEDDVGGEDDPTEEQGGWEVQFAQFKKDQKAKGEDRSAASNSQSDGCSEGRDTVGRLPALPVIGGKRRRKGASDASGYSMSSSSMFRNEGLTILDERFDQIEKEYASDEEEEETEALSSDEEEGAPELITSREDFDAIMDDFLDNYEIVGRKMRHVLPGDTGADKLDTMRRAMGEDERVRLVGEHEEEEDDDLMSDHITEKNIDRWDCETILSTYTNLENHPRLIRARDSRSVPQILLDPKTGLPSIQPKKAKESRDVEAVDLSRETSDDREARPVQGVISRPKDETKEEKRARKQVVKAERQARRVEKRETRETFSNEKREQLRTLANRDTRGLRKL